MKSLWSEEYQDIPQVSKLEKDISTDTLIIGGGIAGILCAYKLKEKGMDVTLVEGHRICAWNTCNTTAKITAQHGIISASLIDKYGTEKARQYYDINTAAIDKFRELSKKIECDFEDKTAYVYSLDNPKKLERERLAYEKLGIPYTWLKNPPIGLDTVGALGIPSQAQFHPLKLLKDLLPNIKYYESTFVNKIDGNKAITKYGTVTAKNIVIATHYPMVNIPGLYFLKLVQKRSYALAIKNAADVDGMYIDENHKGISFRNYKDMLILTGGDHRPGNKSAAWEQVRNFARKTYPNAAEKYRWSAQDCITLDDVPYIGIHRKSSPNLYVATGFNKWGMTSSMAAAIVLSELIESGKSEYEELFSPQRSIAHARLAVNTAESLKGLLTPGKRCDHMGCKLTWNSETRSWDCPCHGSRFDRDGHVIDNPAKNGISV
jgi:glycine/D-amino acid oxidase-like deaminating enzyme